MGGYAVWEVDFGVKPRFGDSPTLCLRGVYAYEASSYIHYSPEY
jgi:hypothetical protein